MVRVTCEKKVHNNPCEVTSKHIPYLQSKTQEYDHHSVNELSVEYLQATDNDRMSE
jgi:hypothetical protein